MVEGVNLTVNVDIELLSGELGREVVIRVFTINDTAQGTYL